MAQKKVSDEVLIASYEETHSYTATGRAIGMSTTGVKSRVLTLKSKGVKLPDVKPQGWAAAEGAKLHHEQSGKS